ncbi:hypothetical protein GCM10020358_09610 [Amorphoplanes nipponensis]
MPHGSSRGGTGVASVASVVTADAGADSGATTIAGASATVVSSALAFRVQAVPVEPTTATARPAASKPRRAFDTCPSSFIGGARRWWAKNLRDRLSAAELTI